jgi:hypothetical protein
LPESSLVDGSNDRPSNAGSTATGRTLTVSALTGSAAGSTEKAGDLADRDERRRDFLGGATSAGTSGTRSAFWSLDGSIADSTTTRSSLPWATGATETAGDLADREERRLDFVGAATSAETSCAWSTFSALDDSAALEDSVMSPCDVA